MSYKIETHTLYRPVCDYPCCRECYIGKEYGLYASRTCAVKAVQDDMFWIVLEDASGVARFFCPRHIRLNEKGLPVLFNESGENLMPSSGKLNERYLESVGDNPLPKLDCEDTIRKVLKGDGK